MFSRQHGSTATRIRLKVVTADRDLAARLRSELPDGKRFAVDIVKLSVIEAASASDIGANASVLFVDLDPRQANQIGALESIIASVGTSVSVVVLSEDLGNDTARRLLHLRVADWLPRSAPTPDLLQACERAINAREAVGRTHVAKVYAFYPAMGGVGNSTLAVATGFNLTKGKRKPQSVCLVDLDLQSGILAEYLDLTANIQFDDLISRPERLDGHLLEVLQSRHASESRCWRRQTR